MNIRTSSSEHSLIVILKKQISSLFGLTKDEISCLQTSIPLALQKVAICFMSIKLPPYIQDGLPYFDYLHSAQYTVFLCFLREMVGQKKLSDKLYLLNKTLHCIDLYSASIPQYILFEHPLGTVIGRAKLGSYCTFYQQVCLGGVLLRNIPQEYKYPVISDHVIFFAGAKALGNTTIGAYSILATNTCVINETIPPHSLVFGESPHLTIKHLSLSRYEELSPFFIFHPSGV